MEVTDVGLAERWTGNILLNAISHVAGKDSVKIIC